MSKVKEKYYSVSGELDDLRYGFGAKDKAIAGVKLISKSAFNVTKFIFTVAMPAYTEKMKEDIERRKSK